MWALTDALIAGDVKAATRQYLCLREQGERLTGCLYLISQSLRDALGVAVRLGAGESQAEIKRTLRMSPRNAERFIANVRRSSPERLRRALATLADLELHSRGGAIVSASRSGGTALSEDTAALRTLPSIVA